MNSIGAARLISQIEYVARSGESRYLPQLLEMYMEVCGLSTDDDLARKLDTSSSIARRWRTGVVIPPANRLVYRMMTADLIEELPAILFKSVKVVFANEGLRYLLVPKLYAKDVWRVSGDFYLKEIDVSLRVYCKGLEWTGVTQVNLRTGTCQILSSSGEVDLPLVDSRVVFGLVRTADFHS